MATAEPVAVAVMAKAPGFAKTRLIPVLGSARTARLQTRLIERAVGVACAANIGPVTVWTTPDETHTVFQTLASRAALARQPAGDLGARMHAAFTATGGPTVVIGTDCPELMPTHLRAAVDVLRAHDAVVCPAEDGGYVLIGLRRPNVALFAGMAWSTPEVMAETRQRLRHHRLSWQEPATLWDLDNPEDLPRLRGLGLLDEFSR